MKFLHAADIHLDSPMRGLERYEGAPVEEMRNATRSALKNMVRLCLDEQVDLLLISGDLYDREWKDFNTGLFFIAQVSRLTREGIPVVLIRGNHDASSQITLRLRLPGGVRELSVKKPETLIFDTLGVAVHGQSYPRWDTTDDLSASYPAAVPGLFNIGMLHTALDGREGHDLYAPCTLGGLLSKGYQYWALGHVHTREVVNASPPVIFPGNLQGRHVRESGPKGATLVAVDDGEIVSAEHVDLDAVRWSVCTVDTERAASGHDVVDLAREAFEAATNNAGGRTLAVRVICPGRTKAHGDIAKNPAYWANQVRAAAGDLAGALWVEKVSFQTKTPVDLDALLLHDDPIGDLLRGLQQLRGDPEGMADIARAFSDLGSKLPPEYRQLDDAINPDDGHVLSSFLGDAAQILVSRLLEEREKL